MTTSELKEAIETIKTAKAEVEWNYPLDYQIAFDRAIEIMERELKWRNMKWDKPKAVKNG